MRENLTELDRMIYGPTPEVSKTAAIVQEVIAPNPPMVPRTTPSFAPARYLPKRGSYYCTGSELIGEPWKCSELLDRPWGVCMRCSEEAKRREFRAALSQAYASIPPRFRWARPGAPEAIARIRSWEKDVKEALEIAINSNRNVVLVGDGRRGKTSGACVGLRGVIDQGLFESLNARERLEYGNTGKLPAKVDRARNARFVPASELKYESSESFALRNVARAASLLVFDGVGGELDSAPEGSGFLPGRIGLGRSVVDFRHDHERQTFYTTAFDKPKISKFFGDDFAGRMFEGAIIINLGRAKIEG
jgi:hypothetical protein